MANVKTIPLSQQIRDRSDGKKNGSDQNVLVYDEVRQRETFAVGEGS